MQSNFPKIQLILSVIFFCVFLLGFIFFFRRVNINNHDLYVKESEWQKEAIRRDGIKKIDRRIRAIAEDKKELESHFAESSDVVPFLDTMEGLAVLAGVKAETTSIDMTPDKASLTVEMKASGSFNGVYKFLTLLENSPYEIEFSGVDLRKETDGSKWNMVLKIKLISFVN